MIESGTSCIRCVGGVKLCSYCGGTLRKHGYTKSLKTRYSCKKCGKTQVAQYSYQAYTATLNKNIIAFTKEGMGIRSTARLLQISTTTLLKRLRHIAHTLEQPVLTMGKSYEVDELHTFINRKDRPVWIVCALCRNSGKIVRFKVGSRTSKTLQTVLQTLTHANAQKIYTDRLKNYGYLLGTKIHTVKRYGTNRIERMNLTLRTHLKRLNRRTICYSKSLVMLTSILTIYFWG